MFPVGTEEGCRGCIVQEETRSNLCRPGATNSALIPAHHTHPPALLLKTYVLWRPHYIKWEMCLNSCWARVISDCQLFTLCRPSVLLYHSISKSCIRTSVVTAGFRHLHIFTRPSKSSRVICEWLWWRKKRHEPIACRQGHRASKKEINKELVNESGLAHPLSFADWPISDSTGFICLTFLHCAFSIVWLFSTVRFHIVC